MKEPSDGRSVHPINRDFPTNGTSFRTTLWSGRSRASRKTVVGRRPRAGKNPKEDKEYDRKKNALTNALGVKENFHTDNKMLQLKAEDVYLLCSDGFYEYINPYTKLQEVNEPQQMLFVKEKELLQTSAKDNYTAVLFMIEQEEIIEITELENTLFL